MGRRRRSRRRGKCFSNGNVKIDNLIKRRSKLRQNGEYTRKEMLDSAVLPTKPDGLIKASKAVEGGLQTPF
jgi:hypothetical protein